MTIESGGKLRAVVIEGKRSIRERWHVLLVEDDEGIHRLLHDKLRVEGFEVTGVYDAESALSHIKAIGLPHLALVDIGLPGMDGRDLARELCTSKSVPIIMITSYDARETVIQSLQWADDYVRKPFEPAELVQRVRRVLSRIGDFSYAGAPTVEIDKRIKFDYGNDCLIVTGKEVSLTPIESQLLHTLMMHKGTVVDAPTLIARVWNTDSVYEDALRVHIHRLRRKLESDARNPKHILTVRGVGYSFE